MGTGRDTGRCERKINISRNAEGGSHPNSLCLAASSLLRTPTSSSHHLHPSSRSMPTAPPRPSSINAPRPPVSADASASTTVLVNDVYNDNRLIRPPLPPRLPWPHHPRILTPPPSPPASPLIYKQSCSARIHPSRNVAGEREFGARAQNLEKYGRMVPSACATVVRAFVSQEGFNVRVIFFLLVGKRPAGWDEPGESPFPDLIILGRRADLFLATEQRDRSRSYLPALLPLIAEVLRLPGEVLV
jgi:hypothetical protein